jgi:hypothetical protein
MKLCIRKRNTLRKGKIHNTSRKKNQMKRTYRKIHTGGKYTDTVWYLFDKIKWEYTAENKSTTVRLTYTKEGRFSSGNSKFDVTLVYNPTDNSFILTMNRLNSIGKSYNKTLNIIFEFDVIDNNNYRIKYNTNSYCNFSITSTGSISTLHLEPNKVITFNGNVTEKYTFIIDRNNLSNYAFFLSLSEQMYKMYILNVSLEYPIPSFLNMLVVRDDNVLLNIICSNFKLFIEQLHSILPMSLPYRQYDGITPELTNVTEKSYLRCAQIMECFKNRQFNLADDINTIFLETFNAIYNTQTTTYILQHTQHTPRNEVLPFIFNRILGSHGKIGTPYIITHTLTNTDIIMKISNNISLHIDVVCAPESNDTCVTCLTNQKNKQCFQQTHTINYIIKSSEFINETIIGYVLNTIFFQKHNLKTPQLLELTNILNGELLEGELGNSVYQIGHFQSNDNCGSNIMEKADAVLDKLFNDEKYFNQIKIEYNGKIYYGCIPTHKDIIITMLLLQLSNTLQIVAEKLGMIHGDLKAGNVFFSIKPNYLTVDYPLNNTIKIKTNIRLKIADYGKSSIIYEGIRFYCDAFGSSLITTHTSARDEKLNENNEYSLDYGTLSIKVSMPIDLRHLPCPYFRSIDLYCVIISLAIQSPIFMNFYMRYDIGKLLFAGKDPLSLLSVELLANKTLLKHAMDKYPNSANFNAAIESIQQNKLMFSIHAQNPAIGPYIINIAMECIKLYFGSDKVASINTAFKILNKNKLNCLAIELCIDKCIKIFNYLQHVDTVIHHIDEFILKYRQFIFGIEPAVDIPVQNQEIDTILTQIEQTRILTTKLLDRTCDYIQPTIVAIEIMIVKLTRLLELVTLLHDKSHIWHICNKIINKLTAIKTNITPFV